MRVIYRGGPLDGIRVERPVAEIPPVAYGMWALAATPVDVSPEGQVTVSMVLRYRKARYEASVLTDGTVEYRYVPD